MENLQRKKDEGSYNKSVYHDSVYSCDIKLFALTALEFNITMKEMISCPSPLYFLHL
ncbi:hypothetical protein [Terrisporobacter glycolicus]|uniref:hypothetical protein n=1 Tax=Terrisporobacter glycolicus TaxID=36841 RepID=UPI003463923B